MKWTIYVLILLLCVSCGLEKPPLEFAPPANIIEKALIFKLEQKQQSLSRQLNLEKPHLVIKKINVAHIETNILFNLPLYHLEGTYQAQIEQKKNKKILLINDSFDLDLQRQSRGKTWRILLKSYGKDKDKYQSYLIN